MISIALNSIERRIDPILAGIKQRAEIGEALGNAGLDGAVNRTVIHPILGRAGQGFL
jgi:hypothetical protein